MSSRQNKTLFDRRTLAKGSVAAIAATRLNGSAIAQDATRAPAGPPPMAEGVTMQPLLEGLLDPRFIVVDGTDVYFTETGNGGDQPLVLPAGEGTPEPAAPVSMHGQTGKLSKLSADGTLTEIVSDFRSYTFGDHGEIVGAAGLALDGAGAAYVAVGAPGPFVGMMPRAGDEGVVYKVDLATGEKEIVADLLQWEIDENPDPAAIDSNLYGAAFLDGMVYVADAGGNDILAIDTATNTVSTFAVTGGLPAPFLPDSGNPARGGDMEIDSVPSTINVGPDGRLYVSFVSGGPFVPGIVPVLAYSVDGSVETFAEGLTMVADLAFDSQGRMYASTISMDFINQAAGQISRVEDDGSLTMIAVVPVPAGIAFDADDNLYSFMFSAVAPSGGTLVKYSGVADVVAGGMGSPEASPVMDTGAASVTLSNGVIEPAALSIAADTDVTISVVNNGTFDHDFTIEDQDLTTGLLEPGQSAELVVNLPAGEYVTFCSQPGHREAGMMGTLTVG